MNCESIQDGEAMKGENSHNDLTCDLIGKPKLKIFGFGSCLITGFPFVWNDGFFGICSNELLKDFELNLGMYAMHGSTADKGCQNIKDVAGMIDGSVVILQFGNTDVSIPLRNRIRHMFGLRRYQSRDMKNCPVTIENSYSFLEHVNVVAPNMWTVMQWCIEGVIRACFCMKPRISSYGYANKLRLLIREVSALGGIPFVVGPTVIGDFFTDKYSAMYNELAKRVSYGCGAIYVDSRHATRNVRNADVLLADGQHLSSVGHQLVGKSISQAIVKWYKDRRV